MAGISHPPKQARQRTSEQKAKRRAYRQRPEVKAKRRAEARAYRQKHRKLKLGSGPIIETLT